MAIFLIFCIHRVPIGDFGCDGIEINIIISRWWILVDCRLPCFLPKFVLWALKRILDDIRPGTWDILLLIF